MEGVYRFVGVSRQGVHQAFAQQKKQQKLAGALAEEILEFRKTHAKMGSRALFYNLEIKARYGLGVNRFEQLVSQMGLTIKPLRLKVVTTRRCALSHNYVNLVNGLELSGVNQLIVGDLTLLIVGNLRWYIFSLWDVYSARCVGLWGNDRMTKEDALQALDQLFKLRGSGPFPGSIHHSDGGGQYFSNAYLGKLKAAQMQISVAGNCLENGYAEQRHNTLKNEYLRHWDLSTKEKLQQALKRLKKLYNTQRKQQALGWKSPVAYENWIKGLPEQERPVKVLHDFTGK